LVIDLSAPPAPTIDGPIEGDDLINAVEDNDVLLTGSSDAGATIDVTFDDGVNPVVTAQVTADGAGNWTLLGSEADISGLNQGAISISATATDAFSNSSAATMVNVTHDSVIATPTLTIDTLVNDAEDNSLTASGTADANSSIAVTFDDGVNAQVVAAVVADGSGNWTLTGGNEVDISGLNEGSITVTVDSTDPAGNTANLVSALNHDSLAPTVTVAVQTTSDTSPALFGSIDDPTATLSVTVAGNTYAAINNGDGTWTLADNTISPALADGIYDVAVTVTDSAGNIANDVTVGELTIDAGAPAAPTIDAPIELDNIISAAEDNDVLVSGSAEANSTVDVMFDDGINPVVTAQVTADGAGNWTLLGNEADISGLNQGTISISATATDGASNTSPATTVNVTHDSIAPTVSVVPQITIDTSPALSGTIDDPTATVSVTVDGNTYAATNNGDGTWMLADNTISPPLSDGTYDVLVTVTDSVGNTNTDVTTNELVIDTTPPQAPVVSGISNASSFNGGYTTFDMNPSFTGTAEANATVEILIDGVSVGITSADASGNWTYTYSGASLTDNSYTISAQATDTVGLIGPVSSGKSFTVDTTVAITSNLDTNNELMGAGEDLELNESFLYDGAILDAISDIESLGPISPLSANGAVLNAVQQANDDRESIVSTNTSPSIDEQILAESDTLKGFSFTFALPEFSQSGSDAFESFMNEDADSFEEEDQLIVRTFLRDRTIYIELNYAINSRPDLNVESYEITLEDGSALPEWLNVDDKGGLVYGDPPVGVESIRLRLEVTLSEDPTIVRYFSIDTSSGEIASLVDMDSSYSYR
jgi:hypothetical protein